MRFCTHLTARFLTVVALCTILIASAIQPARASSGAIFQDAISLESVLVDIWPEYDQPSVLVMYNITLSSDVKLPASLSISIPASAGQPHAVATKDTNGLYNLDYDTAPAGDWVKISFTTSMPEFRIEYYDPAMTRQDQQRSFTYRWIGDYAVKNLSIQVQQPANATNMKFSQNLGSGVKQDDLTYYNLIAGAQEAGKEFKLDISYQKPNDTLTNAGSFQQAQPSEKVGDQTAGRITLNEILPWTLGGLGVLLIGTGVWWYWRAGRQEEPAHTRARHTRKSASSTPSSGASGAKQEGAYCHQCGKRAAVGDVFCRACGTKLRA